MFVSKARFDLTQQRMEAEIHELRQKYWRMYADHHRLLDHLGLVEVEIPQDKVLREKGGPEQGET